MVHHSYGSPKRWLIKAMGRNAQKIAVACFLDHQAKGARVMAKMMMLWLNDYSRYGAFLSTFYKLIDASIQSPD